MNSKRLSSLGAVLIIGCLGVAQSFAQQPPPAHPATNPNCTQAPTPGNAFSTVVGTAWVYQWESVGYFIGFYGAAAVGNMSFFQIASPNSQSGEAGFINVIESRNIGSEISRFLNYNGRFEIYPDCTGGTLMFNTNTDPIEFDFYFRPNLRTGDPFGSMVMVSIDANNFVAYGDGQKVGPS